MMAYYLLQHNKLPQNLVAETINIYDLMLPVGQEANSGLAGCCWLKVSCEVQSRATVAQSYSHVKAL